MNADDTWCMMDEIKNSTNLVTTYGISKFKVSVFFFFYIVGFRIPNMATLKLNWWEKSSTVNWIHNGIKYSGHRYRRWSAVAAQVTRILRWIPSLNKTNDNFEVNTMHKWMWTTPISHQTTNCEVCLGSLRIPKCPEPWNAVPTHLHTHIWPRNIAYRNG